MKVINKRKNLIDFILNFAQDEYSTKEDLYNLSIETVEQLEIRVKQIKEYYNNIEPNENNKLILEFMGYPNIANDENKKDYLEDCLKYHSSWDWLIPVANEIIRSRDEQNDDWDLTDLKYALCTTNIEYVYKAVVEFIKNQNK